MVIHPLTDHRRTLPLDKKGELIAAHPDFQLVISYNPGYQSLMKDLKQSTKQRFTAFDFDYPTAQLETDIVAKETGLDEDTAGKLVKIGHTARNLKGHGLDEGISTRLLVYAATLDQGRYRAARRLPHGTGAAHHRTMPTSAIRSTTRSTRLLPESRVQNDGRRRRQPTRGRCPNYWSSWTTASRRSGRVRRVHGRCAGKALSPEGFSAYLDSASFLGKMGRGVEPILIFLEEWPAVAKALGEIVPACHHGAASRTMWRSPNGKAITPFLQALAAVARRLHSRSRCRIISIIALDLMDRTTGSIHGTTRRSPAPACPTFSARRRIW